MPGSQIFMAKRRPPYCKLFSEKLTQYRDEHFLDAKTIAEAIKVRPVTVQKWLSGRYSPSPKTLRHVCHVLGWRYDMFTSSEMLQAGIWDEDHISFESLNVRYIEARKTRPFHALKYLEHAGTEAHWVFSREGLRPLMQITAVSEVTILLQDDARMPFVVIVSGDVDPSSTLGILVQCRFSNNEAFGERAQISEKSILAIASGVKEMRQLSLRGSDNPN